jgi:hypothetical protein
MLDISKMRRIDSKDFSGLSYSELIHLLAITEKLTAMFKIRNVDGNHSHQVAMYEYLEIRLIREMTNRIDGIIYS